MILGDLLKMNLKEYLKSTIIIGKQPDLKLIYEDLTNAGYKAREIYNAINDQIIENINNTLLDYYKKKNE
jgi:hypothetical protein